MVVERLFQIKAQKFRSKVHYQKEKSLFIVQELNYEIIVNNYRVIN